MDRLASLSAAALEAASTVPSPAHGDSAGEPRRSGRLGSAASQIGPFNTMPNEMTAESTGHHMEMSSQHFGSTSNALGVLSASRASPLAAGGVATSLDNLPLHLQIGRSRAAELLAAIDAGLYGDYGDDFEDGEDGHGGSYADEYDGDGYDGG